MLPFHTSNNIVPSHFGGKRFGGDRSDLSEQADPVTPRAVRLLGWRWPRPSSMRGRPVEFKCYLQGLMAARKRSCVRPVYAATWPLAQMGSANDIQTRQRHRMP